MANIRRVRCRFPKPVDDVFRSIVLGVSICAFLASCNGPSGPREAEFTGTAKYVNPYSDQRLEIGVESFEAGQQVERIVWVYPTTDITVRTESQTTASAGSADDISAGARLLVRTDGTARRSDPPQFDAISVEVILPPTGAR
jgi:hypothetical protein